MASLFDYIFSTSSTRVFTILAMRECLLGGEDYREVWV